MFLPSSSSSSSATVLPPFQSNRAGRIASHRITSHLLYHIISSVLVVYTFLTTFIHSLTHSISRSSTPSHFFTLSYLLLPSRLPVAAPTINSHQLNTIPYQKGKGKRRISSSFQSKSAKEEEDRSLHQTTRRKYPYRRESREDYSDIYARHESHIESSQS